LQILEGAQIVTDEWPLIVFQETGSWLPVEEVLRNIFVELARHGLENLVPDLSVTRNHKRKMKSDNAEYISTRMSELASRESALNTTPENISLAGYRCGQDTKKEV
jgi:hypothetical protein